jgi:poly(A) polymerase Pap1
MPIVMPAYPCMKCTYNVTEPTQRAIAEQIHANHQACQEIAVGHASWDTLFQPLHFFRVHKSYLQVDATAARTSSESGRARWSRDTHTHTHTHTHTQYIYIYIIYILMTWRVDFIPGGVVGVHI